MYCGIDIQGFVALVSMMTVPSLKHTQPKESLLCMMITSAGSLTIEDVLRLALRTPELLVKGVRLLPELQNELLLLREAVCGAHASK